MMMKVYVVTEPPSVRGISATWAACDTVVAGVSGARCLTRTAPS
jgi:hypothetical protein